MTQRRPRVEELEWCHDIVVDVSRTFAITVDQLDPPMSDRICVGYLICRIADTVEDAAHIPPATQVTLLDQYRRVLVEDESILEFRDAVDEWIPAPEHRSDDWEVVAQAPRVFDAFQSLPATSQDAIRKPAAELVEGMGLYVDRYADSGGLRIRTIEELEDYCWYAAGTVGELVTNLLVEDATADEAETMRANAQSFALLLQLVNIAKDVGSDYHEENNVYLPAEWLADAGISPDDVGDPTYADSVASVVDRVVDRAADYVDDAQQYLMAMPETQGNSLGAWAIPQLLAVGTIRELRKRPGDVVDDDVKVSRAEVYTLISQFERGISKDQLPELQAAMQEQPLHQVSSH